MTDPRRLDGRVAFVTGSGRGLGHAIATRLIDLGADCIIHDLTVDAPHQYGEANTIHDVAAKLAFNGRRVIAVTGNISDPDAVARMAATAFAAFPAIDILVNCAGGDIGAQGTKPAPNGALNISDADLLALVNNNFIGLVQVCKHFVPPMVERHQGAVVNIASAAAHFGVSPEAIYSSLKAAVAHYTRCLAHETRRAGVRVNAVSPGPTMTARFVNTRPLDPHWKDSDGSLERYGHPHEIADMVAYLCSDAASYVHGQVIRVDGGMTLYA